MFPVLGWVERRHVDGPVLCELASLPVHPDVHCSGLVSPFAGVRPS